MSKNPSAITFSGIPAPAHCGSTATFRHQRFNACLALPYKSKPFPATIAPLAATIAARSSRFRLLRQFAVEIHYASAKHSKVRRLLRQALDRNIGQIRESIVGAQRAGALELADSGLLACTVMVFIMGLMHMDTLLPHLVGDPEWQEFVEKPMSALLGTRDSDPDFAKG